MTYEPLAVAVVGLGWWARVIADAAARSPRLRLASCFSRSAEGRAEFAARHGCPQAPSLGALLDDSSVEALLVTTPNDAHAEIIEAAAAAGKHIFVEKPIANTMADGGRIVATCEQAGVKLVVGHCARRLGGCRALKRLLDTGELGEVSLAEANFSNDRGLELDPDRWRWYRDKSPGGPLIQLSVHSVDTLNYLLGRTARVTAMLRRLYTPAEVDDVAALVAEMESGPLCYVGSSWAASGAAYFVNLYGTRAAAFFEVDVNYWHDGPAIDAHSTVSILRKGASGREVVPLERGDMYREELEELADAVRLSRQPETDGRSALEALAVIRAALESAETGRVVEVGTGR